ncbi:hypothetical protein LG329_12345 [Virgibacillus necropolis]|uniref:DUF6897 domain-containing protein n=1 Tax=Virgibacillus necropolis TaxID=163877 RepID=UPI00384D40F9
MNEHHNLLSNLIGHEIKVVYPGPHTIKGLLVDIKEDYLILKNEKDLTHYIKLDNIKELTKNTKNLKVRDLSDIKFVNKPNFVELLKAFENEWLTVSRDGTEAIEGFLSNVHNVYITFIVNDEISFIPISQIATGASNLVKQPKQEQPSKHQKKSSDHSPEHQDSKTHQPTNQSKNDNPSSESSTKDSKEGKVSNYKKQKDDNIASRLNKLAKEITSKQHKESNKQEQEQTQNTKTYQSKQGKKVKQQKEKTESQQKQSTKKQSKQDKSVKQQKEKTEPQQKQSNKYKSKQKYYDPRNDLTPQQVMRNRRKARERRKASGK